LEQALEQLEHVAERIAANFTYVKKILFMFELKTISKEFSTWGLEGKENLYCSNIHLIRNRTIQEIFYALNKLFSLLEII
jgi:hypothetical protein